VDWERLNRISATFKAASIIVVGRVCDPTKIMDAMGSGRPIVATALPECRLHVGRFRVAENRDEFVESIRTILGNGSDDGRAGLRHAYALANTCHGIGERILDLIGSAAGSSRPHTGEPDSLVRTWETDSTSYRSG
jgi:hypothetical protein